MTFTPCDHHAQAEQLARTTPEDWEARGMKPVSREALKRAMEWLNGLVLVPDGDGNVLVEVLYGGCDFELDFDANGPVILLASKDDRIVAFDYTKDAP